MDVESRVEGDRNQDISEVDSDNTQIEKEPGIDLKEYLRDLNSLEPITPETGRLKMDDLFRLKSPLTVCCPRLESALGKSKMEDGGIPLSLNSSPRTPREDPFIQFSVHPLNFSIPEQEKESIRCFNSIPDDENVCVDDDPLKERSSMEVVNAKQGCGLGFNTPSPYFFRGDIDECCPGAPLVIKHASKFTNIDPKICRRLF